MAMRFTILYNVLFILLHLAGATDGSWTQWGSWSACTPQCYQTRKRTCTARICKNYDTDTQFCNAAGRSCSKWKADGSAPFTLSKCKHEEGRCLTGLRRRIQNKGVIYINDLTDSGVMESFSDCFELCQRIPGMTGCMYGKFKCWAHTQPLLPRYEESFKDPSHICWVKDICRKPLDGDWSQWGPWDVCRRPCFHGDQFRRRTCTNPAPQKGGRGCPESSGHHRMCNPNSCKDLDLHSSCKKEQEECLDESGRGHIQTMGKKLNHGKEKDCLEKCMDDLYYGSGCTFIKSTGYCYTHTKPVAGGNGDDGAFCWVFKKCKINGKWSKWGAWGECSVSCGPGGKQTRRRTCTNPIPNAGGLDCPKSDNDSQTRNCKTRICPTHGKWSAWGSWGKCSASCGGGKKTRTRTCTNPAPRHGGMDCGDSIPHILNCNLKSCPPTHGKWSQWGSWGKCSASCGAGQKTRTRTCTNPAPRHGGRECGDSNTHTLNCNLKSCPIVVHGKWSEWGSWGKCSASCGSGQKTRTRTCTNPAPQNGGRDCTDIKNDIENQKCNTNTCPNNNKVAEKVCKKQCSQLKGNCGQMLRCGDIELDVSNLCPETCAATTHGTNKDNNEVAEKFCKVKCVYLKSNCGQTLGCGETKFDVSNLCSETCAGTRGPKDNNQWAEKDCKVKCVYLKSNCGQLLECRRNTKWYISNLCPKTCATTNLGTKDNNEVAEKVCKMQCVHLKGKCGQMLKCGEAQLDVSNLCPKTCAATSHTTKDNNEVAENFCKKRCFHLIENCGQMVRCGDTKLDVSNLCPKTCATTTHGTKDNNELAEKICKKRCDQLERNCGEIKRCAGYTMLDVSNVCPETCAHKDNDKVAEKVCKKRCVHFKGNCGQMVKCGNTKFDVSNHCPKTCAATLCEPKKEAMVMCHGRSYTLHGKTKNGASAKQYEWYKKSKKDSLVQLDSDSEYSITYSDRDPTKSSLTILSFSMVKHEGLYAFREANLNYIDCYDYKVKGVLQVEYIDGKDMFDVVAGENITLAVKAKDPASKTSWSVDGQSLIEPLIKASPHYNLPSTGDFGPTTQMLEILNPQRRHGGIYKLKWSTDFDQCPIADILFNVTVRERNITASTMDNTNNGVNTTTSPNQELNAGQRIGTEEESDDSVGYIPLIFGSFLLGIAKGSIVLWFLYKRGLARKNQRSSSNSSLLKANDDKPDSRRIDQNSLDGDTIPEPQYNAQPVEQNSFDGDTSPVWQNNAQPVEQNSFDGDTSPVWQNNAQPVEQNSFDCDTIPEPQYNAQPVEQNSFDGDSSPVWQNNAQPVEQNSFDGDTSPVWQNNAYPEAQNSLDGENSFAPQSQNNNQPEAQNSLDAENHPFGPVIQFKKQPITTESMLDENTDETNDPFGPVLQNTKQPITTRNSLDQDNEKTLETISIFNKLASTSSRKFKRM